jgi:hypothetical protein
VIDLSEGKGVEVAGVRERGREAGDETLQSARSTSCSVC